ncbi:hypothetical protein ACOSP7_023036 [Xanthoceras sorbifolium]
MSDFRSISLCSVIFKVISKALTTRLRGVMDSFISSSQSAFIPGPIITDNSIIGFECLHALKRKVKGKKGFLAAKLDMSKAYDRVKWDFLEGMMDRLRFSPRWISRVMLCVRSVSYSFLVNVLVCGEVRPTRGLRQGDRLSPYLFLFYAEGLSALFNNAELSGSIAGFNNKKGLFHSIKYRVWAKLQGWNAKLFSVGGREILLKAVVQSIPVYSMNLFKLPKALIWEIHSLCAKCWWGSDHGRKKIHWGSWDKLCTHKMDEGLGFRDLHIFNKAMLAKQSWRILRNPSSLAARVLKGCYFPHSDFLRASGKPSSSFVWRSLLWGRELILQGSRKRFGSGNSILIYKDRWIPRPSTFSVISQPVVNDLVFVSQLKLASGAWNELLIRSVFLALDADAILSISSPSHRTADSVC